MIVRNLFGVFSISLMLFSGCTSIYNVEKKSQIVKDTNNSWQNKASKKVQGLLKKGNFEVVDTN